MNPNVIVDGSGSAPVNRESLKGVRPLEVVLPFINIVLICVHSHNVLQSVQLATRAARGNKTYNL